MRLAALATCLLLLTAALAGCLAAEEDAEPTESDARLDAANDTPENATNAPDPTGADLNVTVTWFNGSVQGTQAPAAGHVCLLACDNRFSFNVTDDATGLLAEMSWEADASMLFDVDVPYEACEVSMGQDCPPESTSGEEGRLEIRLTDPSRVPPGEWDAAAWAQDSPTEPVAFTIAVSVFHGEVPADYAKTGPD